MIRKVYVCRRHVQGLAGVVKHLDFYYVFTTIDGSNMPCYAPLRHFYTFRQFRQASGEVGIMRHFTAYHGISGRRFAMTKILFVCHGSRDREWISRKSKGAKSGIVERFG